MPLIIAAAVAAEAERRRQQGRTRPAYRNRYLGGKHTQLERHARELLNAAQPGTWHTFYAGSTEDAATVDQCLRYIVRQERPAESARVEWQQSDGSWRAGFPRPADRRGHGETARIRREVREELRRAGGTSRPALYGPELARMKRVQSRDGSWWYPARLRLGPKRGTVAPPVLPLPRASMAELLSRALAGDE